MEVVFVVPRFFASFPALSYFVRGGGHRTDIVGGSGFFETDSPHGQICNGVLVASPVFAGREDYSVRDVCSNSANLTLLLESLDETVEISQLYIIATRRVDSAVCSQFW
jgi:hypothetical protein